MRKEKKKKEIPISISFAEGNPIPAAPRARLLPLSSSQNVAVASQGDLEEEAPLRIEIEIRFRLSDFRSIFRGCSDPIQRADEEEKMKSLWKTYVLVEKVMTASLLPHEWYLIYKTKKRIRGKAQDDQLEGRIGSARSHGSHHGPRDSHHVQRGHVDSQRSVQRRCRSAVEIESLSDSKGMAGSDKNYGRRNEEEDRSGSATTVASHHTNNKKGGNTIYYDLNYLATGYQTLKDLAAGIDRSWQSAGPSIGGINKILEEMVKKSIKLDIAYNPKLTEAEIVGHKGKTRRRMDRKRIDDTQQSHAGAVAKRRREGRSGCTFWPPP